MRHIAIVGASLLAMAVYQSTTMLDLMASSRAARSYREPCAPHYYCGSQPAGDGGVSINDDVGSDGLIASRLAPTGGHVRHITIVGASLLAMAVYQPTTMLDLMASSRSGSLLQGACGACVIAQPRH
ncbi:hypothetical protein EMIT0P74_20414 [Pseudomonas sp. IT-P74]